MTKSIFSWVAFMLRPIHTQQVPFFRTVLKATDYVPNIAIR